MNHDSEETTAMISWKTYWSAGGAAGTAGAAAMMALAGFPTLLGVAFLVVAAVVFVITSAKVVQVSHVFADVELDAKQTIVRWLAGAAAVHVVWGSAFLLQPAGWPLWFIVIAAIGALEYWVARGHEYLLKRRPKKQELVQAQAVRAEMAVAATQRQVEAQREAQRPALVMAEALNDAGYDWLNILDWSHIGREDRLVGAWFDVRIPPRSALAKNGKRGSAEVVKLDGKDVEPIAIALADVMHLPIESDWVQITKKPIAGTYRISVLHEDVMANVVVFQDLEQWASITAPALVGYQIDGAAYEARLDQHWADVGQSRSGKSSLVNVKFAYITRCRDAVLWVCGVEKLFDLVWPWVEPYMNTDLRMPIDWIASGPWDTVRMMVAGMRVARWRQAQPHARRAGFKKIIIQLDEASFALVINKVFEKYESRNVTPTQAAEMLVKGAGSGGVHFHIASQRGTNNNWGDCGGDINANIAVQTCFRTKDQAEVGRATGDYQLPIPRHKGEFWLEPGTGDPVLRLKAPYIQETDPNRDKLHDGPTISDIAWSRRNFITKLDEDSARAAGEHYARRYLTATDELMAYLTGMDLEDVLPEESAAFTEAEEQMSADIDAMLAQAGFNLAVPAEDATPAPDSEPAPTVTPAAASVMHMIEAVKEAVDEAMEDPQTALPLNLDRTGPAAPRPRFTAPLELPAAPIRPGSPAPAPPGGGATVIAVRLTMKDRIIATLDATQEPMTRGEIVAALEADTESASAKNLAQQVTNALSKLVSDRAVERLEKGTYTTANR